MTFATSEASLDSGEPYELHEFRLGETAMYYRYADAPADIIYDNKTFTKAYCSGSRIEQGVNAIKSRTVVKCDWENPFAWQYTVCAPDDIIHYTRYKGHGSDIQAIFKGDVLDVVFRQEDRKGKRWCEIVIDPSTAAMQRMGLVQRYSRQCQVELYSDLCGVGRDDPGIKVSGTLDSVSGLVLVSSSFGDEDDYIPEYPGDITALPGCQYEASTYMNYATTPAEAFDDRLPPNHYWASTSAANQWIRCQWTAAKRIRGVNIQPCHAIGYSQWNPRHIKIEGSNNGTDWTKVPINVWYGRCSAYNTDEAEIEQINNHNDWVYFRLDNSTLYTFYRVFCYDNWGGSGFIAISEIEMREDDPIVDGYLKGGDILVNSRRRKIIAHAGDTVTISPGIPGVAALQAFDAWPGCDHLIGTCHNKFGNLDNYKGQPNIPDENPFSLNGIL